MDRLDRWQAVIAEAILQPSPRYADSRARPGSAALADEQLAGGLTREAQQRLRYHTEHESRGGPDSDRKAGVGAWPDHNRSLGRRLAEEHQNDHAHVRERKDGAADDSDDDERKRATLDRRPEHGELASESARQRYASKRDEEERENSGDQWRPLPETRPPGHVGRLARTVPYQGDDREGADRGESVRRQVEQAAGQACCVGCDHAGEDVAGLRDRRVGEQPFHVRLRNRDYGADQHRDNGDGPHRWP